MSSRQTNGSAGKGNGGLQQSIERHLAEIQSTLGIGGAFDWPIAGSAKHNAKAWPIAPKPYDERSFTGEVVFFCDQVVEADALQQPIGTCQFLVNFTLLIVDPTGGENPGASDSSSSSLYFPPPPPEGP